MPQSPERSHRARELAKQYTLDHCEELLRADPGGTCRLFAISQGWKVPAEHAEPRVPEEERERRREHIKRIRPKSRKKSVAVGC